MLGDAGMDKINDQHWRRLGWYYAGQQKYCGSKVWSPPPAHSPPYLHTRHRNTYCRPISLTMTGVVMMSTDVSSTEVPSRSTLSENGTETSCTDSVPPLNS